MPSRVACRSRYSLIYDFFTNLSRRTQAKLLTERSQPLHGNPTDRSHQGSSSTAGGLGSRSLIFVGPAGRECRSLNGWKRGGTFDSQLMTSPWATSPVITGLDISSRTFFSSSTKKSQPWGFPDFPRGGGGNRGVEECTCRKNGVSPPQPPTQEGDAPKLSSSSQQETAPTSETSPSTSHEFSLSRNLNYLSSLPPRLLSLLPISSLPPTPRLSDLLHHFPQSQLGWWSRFRLRWKWWTIRSFRRYRADDWSAFVTWILGTVLFWGVIGTTSFFAFWFAVLNSLHMQENVAQILASSLTSSPQPIENEDGTYSLPPRDKDTPPPMRVVFESAIVPKWGLPFTNRDTRISFKKVYVYRGGLREDMEREHPALKNRRTSKDDEDGRKSYGAEKEQQGEGNWTKFHLVVDSIDVSLSLWRWLDGKGLVKEASVKGVRGVIDRSHISFDSTETYDRTQFRHKPSVGDFHIEDVHVEDFLVTVFQPDNFRPYAFSVFSANIPQLRKQWLILDLMQAEAITGQVDNCLFSLHRPQSIGRTSEEDLRDGSWKRMSRFRVDGVPVDHLQQSQGTGGGPLAWIRSGKADLVADIRFPREPTDDVNLNTIIEEIVENFDKNIHWSGGYEREDSSHSESKMDDRIPGQRELTKDALEAPPSWLWEVLGLGDLELKKRSKGEDVKRAVAIDLDIRFKDVKASVPIFTSDLSYVNNALVRPIVAFMNANKTLIPIKCHVELDLSEFDGSWTLFDCGLLDEVSDQVYAALAYHVQSKNMNKRVQAVSLWTLQMTAQAILRMFKQHFNEVDRTPTPDDQMLAPA